MRVAVYFNLHRKCYSVRAEEGPQKGRVIAHASGVGLHFCTMSVGEAGNRKVRETGKKNVHAFIRGELSYLIGELTKAGVDAETYHYTNSGHWPWTIDGLAFSGFTRRCKSRGIRITYDPYRDESFVVADMSMSRMRVGSASSVAMTKEGAFTLETYPL